MKTFLFFIFVIVLLGCNRKPDLSNPKDVATNYQNLINKGKFYQAFELVSDSSKSILTYQDFQDYYDSEYDSITNANSFFIKDIKQMPLEANFPEYRAFEFKELVVNKISKDSSIYYYYLNVYNQGQRGWLVVWIKHLERAAVQLEEKSKYVDAINVCDKILEYDPINGQAYLLKAWIYFRLGNDRMLEQNGTKALDLAPKMAQTHIIMSAIYDTKGLYESAKLSNQKALLFTSDPQEISQIYSNTSIYCERLDQPDSAIYYLRKAISLTPKTHVQWRLAINFALKNNNDSSIYYFEKAYINNPMDNYLQVQFYSDYSDFLIKRAQSFTKGSEEQKSLILKAKSVVLKALDLDPNDDNSKLLLNRVKSL